MNVTGPLTPILDLLFPVHCLACGTRVRGPAPLLGLCTPCRGRLKPLRGPRCPVCARGLPTTTPPGFRCGRCRRRPPAFHLLLAAWSYEPPIESVIHGLKFRRLEYLGRHLAATLQAGLGSRLGEGEVVVPVPLHWRRQLARGYNQAAAIGRPLARTLRRPYRECLRRCRSTPPQATLPKESRLANLRGAFGVRRRHQVRGRCVLLVDDVVTTGSTLEEAARALRGAGAARIVAVAAARTPPGPRSPTRPDSPPGQTAGEFPEPAAQLHRTDSHRLLSLTLQEAVAYSDARCIGPCRSDDGC